MLLVDDHPAILDQAAQLLRGEFDVVEMLPDGTALEAALARSHPDLVVLDISLPGVGGIELARRLAAAGCPARIVFLTVHEDADFAREALAAGGLGYVAKPRLGTDLPAALRAAAAGQRFISPCPGLEEFLPLSGTGPGTTTRETDGAAWIANPPGQRPPRAAVPGPPADPTTEPRAPDPADGAARRHDTHQER